MFSLYLTSYLFFFFFSSRRRHTRCALVMEFRRVLFRSYWSPFAEIAHPADADRIAQQLITETGQHDRDVWLETSRILVANMLRALWREKKGTLPDLLHALQLRTKDDLKAWRGDSSSARTFAVDADRATGSVIFMLAKAANLIQFLRSVENTSELKSIMRIS